jgi:hypothetical protein
MKTMFHRLQYFDGTVEEMDLEDWRLRRKRRARRNRTPEDWTGSVDVDPKKTMHAAPWATTRKTTVARAPASSKASICSSRFP